MLIQHRAIQIKFQCDSNISIVSHTITTAHQIIYGLVQDSSNSSALAMHLLQSCTQPSICTSRYPLVFFMWRYMCRHFTRFYAVRCCVLYALWPYSIAWNIQWCIMLIDGAGRQLVWRKLEKICNGNITTLIHCYPATLYQTWYMYLLKGNT